MTHHFDLPSPPSHLSTGAALAVLLGATMQLGCSASSDPMPAPGYGSTGGSGTGGGGDPGVGTGGSGSGGDAGTGGGAVAGCNGTGFSVQGGKLYDAACNEFIMRGINYPYAWYTHEDSPAQFAAMAATGANTVRVVMSTGEHGENWARTTPAEVGQIIGWAEENGLVAMLELHDATGFGDSGGYAPHAIDPQNCVDYWLEPEIRAEIDGHEDSVIINIANEPFGNKANETADAADWESFHTAAVAQLRAAGLEHTLVVDAPNWGQDWRNIMRDGDEKTAIFNADPHGNVVFSVHMYDVYGTASTVTSYMDGFAASGLPLIVGEFAADHGVGKEVAEGAILDESAARGIGYLGWSWSGNGGGLESLDMVVSFDASQLTTWGEILINDPNGIRSTSTAASHFR